MAQQRLIKFLKGEAKEMQLADPSKANRIIEIQRAFIEYLCYRTDEYEPVLNWALENKNEELINISLDMLRKGDIADLDIFSRGRNTIITPLIQAIINNNDSVIDQLIEIYKVQIETVLKTKDSIYYYSYSNRPTQVASLGIAFILMAKYGYVKYIEKFIEYGININYWTTELQLGGNSAISIASAEGHEDVVSLLIEKKAELNGDNSPLISATKAGQYNIVKLLLEKGANINVQNGYGETPISIAIPDINKRDIAKLLLSHSEINKIKIDYNSYINTYWQERKKTLLNECSSN